MQINNVSGAQGASAYTANALDSEKRQMEIQNQASARSDITSQEARNAQQAFEVNISQEARQLTAESGTRTGQQATRPPLAAAETAPPAPDPGRGGAAGQQGSQIVNIVA